MNCNEEVILFRYNKWMSVIWMYLVLWSKLDTHNYMYFVHALLLISSVFDLVFVDYKKKES